MLILSLALLLLGAVFMFLAAAGLLKFPDQLTRMAAGSKASTLGLALIFLGAAINPSVDAPAWQLLVCFWFFFLTTPVAAHLLGRSIFASKLKLFKNTQRHDLRKRPGGS